jgi:hypothetical protein
MAKVDALATQAVADGVLYDAGFADGVASVASPTGDVTAAQEQLDIQAAVATAVAPLNSQISALQLAKSTEDQLLASVQSAAEALVALFPVAQPSVKGK